MADDEDYYLFCSDPNVYKNMVKRSRSAETVKLFKLNKELIPYEEISRQKQAESHGSDEEIWIPKRIKKISPKYDLVAICTVENERYCLETNVTGEITNQYQCELNKAISEYFGQERHSLTLDDLTQIGQIIETRKMKAFHEDMSDAFQESFQKGVGKRFGLDLCRRFIFKNTEEYFFQTEVASNLFHFKLGRDRVKSSATGDLDTSLSTSDNNAKMASVKGRVRSDFAVLFRRKNDRGEKSVALLGEVKSRSNPSETWKAIVQAVSFSLTLKIRNPEYSVPILMLTPECWYIGTIFSQETVDAGVADLYCMIKAFDVMKKGNVQIKAIISFFNFIETKIYNCLDNNDTYRMWKHF